jgi:hypothetical protein
MLMLKNVSDTFFELCCFWQTNFDLNERIYTCTYPLFRNVKGRGEDTYKVY